MRYLIVKTSAFGDIIHAYPLIEYLKQLQPDCEIDWVVERQMSQLVSAHPLVSRTILIDTKKWRSSLNRFSSWQDMRASTNELRSCRYDALFDLQGNVKSSLITFLAHAKHKVGFGFKTAQEKVSSLVYTHRYNPPEGLNVRDESLFLVERYFEKKLDISTSRLLALNEPLPTLKGTWMVCLGSNWKNKQVPQEVMERFLDLCHERYKPNYIFLCGNEQEAVLSRSLAAKYSGAEVLFRPSLALLQHIMARMERVLSMDSLPLHLAGTAGCPTFSFFGPSSSNKYSPQGLQHASFQGSCPYGQTFERRCPKLRTCPTGACLREVSAETLFQSFQASLEPLGTRLSGIAKTTPSS